MELFNITVIVVAYLAVVYIGERIGSELFNRLKEVKLMKMGVGGIMALSVVIGIVTWTDLNIFVLGEMLILGAMHIVCLKNLSDKEIKDTYVRENVAGVAGSYVADLVFAIYASTHVNLAFGVILVAWVFRLAFKIEAWRVLFAFKLPIYNSVDHLRIFRMDLLIRQLVKKEVIKSTRRIPLIFIKVTTVKYYNENDYLEEIKVLREKSETYKGMCSVRVGDCAYEVHPDYAGALTTNLNDLKVSGDIIRRQDIMEELGIMGSLKEEARRIVCSAIVANTTGYKLLDTRIVSDQLYDEIFEKVKIASEQEEKIDFKSIVADYDIHFREIREEWNNINRKYRQA